MHKPSRLIHHCSVHLSSQITELFKAYHTDFEANPEDTAYRLNFGKQLRTKIYKYGNLFLLIYVLCRIQQHNNIFYLSYTYHCQIFVINSATSKHTVHSIRGLNAVLKISCHFR